MRTILLILLIGVALSWSKGQQPQLQFKQLTPDDGLSSSSITCMIQDRKGYMWIGTFDGLNRYDGYSFEVYKNNPSDSSSLPQNIISALFEDRHGTIFIGTAAGLSRYDWNRDKFFNYMYEKSSPLNGLNFAISDITSDSLDNLWLSTNFGLVYFDRIYNTYRNYSHNPEDKFSISSNKVECTFIENNHKVWVTTRCGLNLFNPNSGNFTPINNCRDSNSDISNLYFQKIISDKIGNIWFGSYEGLFCLEKNQRTASDKSLELIRYTHDINDPNSLSHNRILSLFVDDRNNLWIGTENGGLNRYDRENRSFHTFRSDPYNPKSLNNESIKDILQDRSGNLWVGTFAGGINIATPNSAAILLYTNLPGAPESLSHNVVTGFLEDHNGKIWVGTDGGGLNQFIRKTGKFKAYNVENSGLSSNVILSIIEDSRQRIWMGTWAGGLNFFDSETGIFKTYTTLNSDIFENDIYAVAEGNDNDLWLGGLSSGLIHFEIEKNKFTSYTQANSNIRNQMITVIRKDHKGNLLIGTPSGLSMLKMKTDSFINYSQNVPGPEQLNNSNIMEICIQNDTMVWVGTQGLYLLNPESGTFKRYFKKDDRLYNSSVKGLLIENDSTLWVATNQGICRFNYNNDTYKLFTKSDGLQSDESNFRSIIQLRDGSILAGGTKGFNQIFPDKITENKHIPNILFTDFQIFNKDVPIGIEDSPLTRHISEIDKLVLSYSQTVLTFYFAAMDFTMPEKNQYAYKMEGFDTRWHEVANKREATYTNLDPGNYVFRVLGSNNDGIWNKIGTSLKITIRPPWWQTILFRVIIVILTISLIFGFYYYRITQLKNQKERLETMVKERTKEIAEKNKILHKQTDELNEINTILEERQQRIEEQSEELKSQAEELEKTNKTLIKLNATKDKFFSIIAHDLKNPFTSILGFCEILISRYQKYDDTKRLHLIKVINQSAEHIFKLLENLLQWSRSQTGTIKFQPEKFNISELINNNIVLIENMINEKQLKINVSVSEECIIYADKNMINTVIRNLLTNAVKFTETGGIQLSIQEDTNIYKVFIKDSGVGMDTARVESLFKVGGTKSTEGTRGETGTGLGLIICKEFVEKNGGKIGVSSEVGKGSTFYFTLPKSDSKKNS